MKLLERRYGVHAERRRGRSGHPERSRSAFRSTAALRNLIINQVIVFETDEHLGVLCRPGQVLGPDGPPAVREALRIIGDAAIDCEGSGQLPTPYSQSAALFVLRTTLSLRFATRSSTQRLSPLSQSKLGGS
jgi:hypothetical protein